MQNLFSQFAFVFGTWQALLYRLSGDYNPLHSDPSYAKAAGYGFSFHFCNSFSCGLVCQNSHTVYWMPVMANWAENFWLKSFCLDDKSRKSFKPCMCKKKVIMCLRYSRSRGSLEASLDSSESFFWLWYSWLQGFLAPSCMVYALLGMQQGLLSNSVVEGSQLWYSQCRAAFCSMCSLERLLSLKSGKTKKNLCMYNPPHWLQSLLNIFSSVFLKW